jgi:hypothetical protein
MIVSERKNYFRKTLILSEQWMFEKSLLNFFCPNSNCPKNLCQISFVRTPMVLKNYVWFVSFEQQNCQICPNLFVRTETLVAVRCGKLVMYNKTLTEWVCPKSGKKLWLTYVHSFISTLLMYVHTYICTNA